MGIAPGSTSLDGGVGISTEGSRSPRASRLNVSLRSRFITFISRRPINGALPALLRMPAAATAHGMQNGG
ncbi:MAG: hypothetical protein QOH64_2164, partial [Acidimicrobiaceae bacterium]